MKDSLLGEVAAGKWLLPTGSPRAHPWQGLLGSHRGVTSHWELLQAGLLYGNCLLWCQPNWLLRLLWGVRDSLGSLLGVSMRVAGWAAGKVTGGSVPMPATPRAAGRGFQGGLSQRSLFSCPVYHSDRNHTEFETDKSEKHY